MNTEVFVTPVSVIAISVIGGCIVGSRQGSEWGLVVAAAGVILAFLFPWAEFFP
jgi:hypothetical protein